jgi:hypothetical protein
MHCTARQSVTWVIYLTHGHGNTPQSWTNVWPNTSPKCGFRLKKTVLLNCLYNFRPPDLPTLNYLRQAVSLHFNICVAPLSLTYDNYSHGSLGAAVNCDRRLLDIASMIASMEPLEPGFYISFRVPCKLLLFLATAPCRWGF